ncbi:hypothetical protein CEXT_752491 [Caerostris extrusa]|uniref:Uncharacterized protein n=1 Tax=Caerostris extrusa TaxID=172846 RepID=A0AAV4N3R7_CAEEX|nr:hypothetical protein CEXT_752491 [Caerostris extrusa]
MYNLTQSSFRRVPHLHKREWQRNSRPISERVEKKKKIPPLLLSFSTFRLQLFWCSFSSDLYPLSNVLLQGSKVKGNTALRIREKREKCLDLLFFPLSLKLIHQISKFRNVRNWSDIDIAFGDILDFFGSRNYENSNISLAE